MGNDYLLKSLAQVFRSTFAEVHETEEGQKEAEVVPITKGKVIFVENNLSVAENEYLTKIYPMLTYRHYGIAVGDGTVIHFQGNLLEPDSYSVRQTTIEEFTADAEEVRVDHMASYKYNPNEVVERAKQHVDSDFGGYHLLKNNCEHFANWCACGKRTSRQVFMMNDDQDVVEKAIDRVFEPLVEFGDRLDQIMGWGDYKK